LIRYVTGNFRSLFYRTDDGKHFPGRLETIVQRGWSRYRRVSSAIEESDLYLYLLTGRLVASSDVHIVNEEVTR